MVEITNSFSLNWNFGTPLKQLRFTFSGILHFSGMGTEVPKSLKTEIYEQTHKN